MGTMPNTSYRVDDRPEKGRVVYKTDFFNCAFCTAKEIHQRLQEMLDSYAAEGWRLHSFQIGNYCSVVFYREE